MGGMNDEADGPPDLQDGFDKEHIISPFSTGRHPNFRSSTPRLQTRLSDGAEPCSPLSPPGVSGALDLTGAEIPEVPKISTPGVPSDATDGAPSITLPSQKADYITHIALDLGGSLIKLVYFSAEEEMVEDLDGVTPPLARKPKLGGKLHFVKFETSQVEECISFIKAKGLHRCSNGEIDGGKRKSRFVATGGGAYKFQELFEKRLGVSLIKADEMECLVSGCNFLLKAIRREAFHWESGDAMYTPAPADKDLYPYLLVNIGSGVSILKVTGDNASTRISGSSLGGGTFWGLCRLLTGVRNFDEMLQMSAQGDNKQIDMLVGDIYGDRDYESIGLTSSTIASSFGKVVGEDKELKDYDKADIAMALARMVSYNIGHLAYMNAKLHNLSRVIFGGFFIRRNPYTMETIDYALRFWSKGEMKATFLRHEGFLGAMGAFLRVHPLAPPKLSSKRQTAQFHETFPEDATRLAWMKKLEDAHSAGSDGVPSARASALDFDGLGEDAGMLSLTYKPDNEPFPLLADEKNYVPDTFNIHSDQAELDYWLGILIDQVGPFVERAISSGLDKDETTGEIPDPEGVMRRGRAAGVSLRKLFKEVKERDPGHNLGDVPLSELFEMREEALHNFGFKDIYRLDKQRENAMALQVLPDVLSELDAMPCMQRLVTLIEGALAANIFDWGARECVELYKNGSIIEIYRKARADLSKRPWRIDTFDELAAKWFSKQDPEDEEPLGVPPTPFRRVIMFVDNAGADVVLGMIPLARELLRMGAEVVMVANVKPAINDITVGELRATLREVCGFCPVIKAAREAAIAAKEMNGGRIPPYPGFGRRVASHVNLHSLADLASAGQEISLASPRDAHSVSSSEHSPQPSYFANKQKKARLYVCDNGHRSPCLDLRRIPNMLADATVGTDLVIIEGMGRAIHTNYNAKFRCDSLKLAMIKNQHLADKLFEGKGKMYDCVCKFEQGIDSD